MANLYEINNAIMDCIDYETGEILDVERLNALQMEKQDKIESVALWIKNLSADAIAFKAEKEAFVEREKKALKKIESLKNWLSWALEGQKFSTWRCAVTFRKSEAVEIEDDCNLPQYLLNEKVTYTPNKTAIKEAIKAGEEIPGCKLVERMNPTIK